jgi:glycosyltransferase involved in cell wall biosynthesis
MRPLRIIIEAQMPGDGTRGGVQQFTASLIRALGRLPDGTEEYVVVGPRRDDDWLRPLLGPNQTLISGPPPPVGSQEYYTQLLSRLHLPLDRLYRRLQVFFNRPLVSPHVPKSRGFYESLGGDVLHFPYQNFVLTDIPTVYNPHDLQHLHYPEFFSAQEIAFRETVWRAGCAHARAVVTASRWVKDDIATKYAVGREKLFSILYGSPTELHEPVAPELLDETRKKFAIDSPFALYPAQTWPHKNHLRLLDAFALLRKEKQFHLKLICTGSRNFFWPDIKRHLKELRLSDHVFFPGFVNFAELRALYRLASFVVFPSLFEGAGFPILEAFKEGTPVTSSGVTSIPEYAGDAALFFDPDSVESIARAIERMHDDAATRVELAKRGSERIKRFSWDRTARAYRAVYRKIGGQPLSDEEELLLEAGHETLAK